MPFILCYTITIHLQDISSAIESTWTSNYGKVCTGMNWELFPTVDDAKVCVKQV